ncbi:MAG TPA: aldose 1-epimerase [Myxococcota bacterium]|nr:aldose 1-epimerase [Myxococcota bacterium]
MRDPTAARRLAAGDLEAVLLPAQGMLVASLRHRGAEILRRVDDLEAAAAKGSTAGIPLLHPWANRLAGLRYRAAQREVALDPSSPLLHLDGNGLPIHGVPWSRLAFEPGPVSPARLAARLEWSRPELLAIFPFRHRLELEALLRPGSLTLETRLVAGPDGPVPLCFGFHPYLGLPALPRGQWTLRLPAMRRLALDGRGIPTGAEEAFAGLDAPLGELDFDDGFALLEEQASFSLAGAGRRISVEVIAGYAYAQIFAPKAESFVALEPMTAPTNALASGRGLRLVEAGGEFCATFRIRVESAP